MCEVHDLKQNLPCAGFPGQDDSSSTVSGEYGHICLYLPKFHCELNPIEQCWCHGKKHTRSHCNGSIVRLRKIVPESLDGITLDTIARFFSKSGDYETAFREGHSCDTVDKAIKQYKSHRRVSTAAEVT